MTQRLAPPVPTKLGGGSSCSFQPSSLSRLPPSLAFVSLYPPTQPIALPPPRLHLILVSSLLLLLSHSFRFPGNIYLHTHLSLYRSFSSFISPCISSCIPKIPARPLLQSLVPQRYFQGPPEQTHADRSPARPHAVTRPLATLGPRGLACRHRPPRGPTFPSLPAAQDRVFHSLTATWSAGTFIFQHTLPS